LQREVRLVRAEAREILGREIDAPLLAVLGDVLAVFEQLERRADVVRQGDALRRRRARRVQHELADGIGRQRAVAAQRIPARVARDDLITPIRLDQPLERCERETPRSKRWRHALQERVNRDPMRRTSQIRIDRVEQRVAITVRLVTRGVDQPGHAVDRDQVVAQRARKPARRDRKILRAGARQQRLRFGFIGPERGGENGRGEGALRHFAPRSPEPSTRSTTRRRPVRRI
jgi:hypothetical protein